MLQTLARISTDCNTACGAVTTVMMLLVIVMPYLIGGAVLITLTIILRRYLKARRNGDIKTKKLYRNLLLLVSGIIAFYFIASVFSAFLYERSSSQRVKNPGFTIYAPPGQKVNGEYLRIPGELTIPHVNVTLNTPKGEIEVIEAKTDQETAKLFMPPDKCDIDELFAYLGIWGKRSMTPTTIKCRLLSSVPDGWTVMTTTEPGKSVSQAPYAAIKGETIIAFQALSIKGFRGTPSDAEAYIVNFLSTSQPVNTENIQ